MQTILATQIRGNRRVTKFRGGYKDPHSLLAENLTPDTSLPGNKCQTIDYETWTNMDAIDAFENRYVAISYKYDLRYPDRAKGETYRAMRAPPVVVDEVHRCMAELKIKKYWHDGGEPLWKDKVPNCRGSYPYLLDGGIVVIVPPFCSENNFDARSWCPNDYPFAARGMLIMSRYKIVNVGAGDILKKRRKAGVPSVAWGDSNRVWMLAEAFCGAIRGEAYLSPRSQTRLHTFVDELDFTVKGLKLLKNRKSRKPDGLDIDQAILELQVLRGEVIEYISIMTDKNSRNDGFRLSSYFVERMAIAGSSYESDRVLLGAVTTFLLEQKFGMGVAPQDALAELEYSDDPFATALAVSTLGNHSFPLGMTKRQVETTFLLAAVRTAVTQHITLSAGSVLNQWPQPQTGRSYVGTLTNSAWKKIFLKALDEGRCMLIERPLEKRILKGRIVEQNNFLKSAEYQRSVAKHSRYRFWRVIFSRGSYTEVTLQHPFFLLFKLHDFSDMPEIDHKWLQAAKEFENAYSLRLTRIRELEALWADRQRRYKILVSGQMPAAISPDGRHYVVYLMDTYGLHGLHQEAVAALTRNDEPLLVIVRDDTTYEINKSYQGRQVSYNIKTTPLLQVVVCSDRGHLIAMRRVWSLACNSRVSISPKKLDTIDKNRIKTNAKALVRDEVFQRDRVIPTSLHETGMKEFAPKYAVISTIDGTAAIPPSQRRRITLPVGNVWAHIADAIYSPWRDGPVPARPMGQGSKYRSFYGTKVSCDLCNVTGSRTDRFKCTECENFDLCKACHSTGFHGHHSFYSYDDAFSKPNVLSATSPSPKSVVDVVATPIGVADPPIALVYDEFDC